MKLTADRPFADPDKAARRLLEHAHAFEPIQEGRIYIEKLNGAGRQMLRTGWYLTALPGVAILLTVLALNLLGEAINDALNPRMVEDRS